MLVHHFLLDLVLLLDPLDFILYPAELLQLLLFARHQLILGRLKSAYGIKLEFVQLDYLHGLQIAYLLELFVGQLQLGECLLQASLLIIDSKVD